MTEADEIEEDNVALIDMDGTVADFDASVREGMIAMASHADITLYGEVDTWDTHPDVDGWMKARIDFIKRKAGFWENLPVIHTGMDVVMLLRRIGYRLMVASKAPNLNEAAWTEKFRWCHKHMPGQQVTLTHDKSLMYGKILFDDWPPYIIAWLKHRPRSHVLMMDTPHNQGFEHPHVMRLFRYDHPAKDVEGKGSGQLKAIEDFLAKPLGPDKHLSVRNQFWETFLVHDPQDGVAGGCLCRCCKRRGTGTGSILHTMDCAAAELSKAWGHKPLQSERPWGGGAG